jgi:hypothetical protein
VSWTETVSRAFGRWIQWTRARLLVESLIEMLERSMRRRQRVMKQPQPETEFVMTCFEQEAFSTCPSNAPAETWADLVCSLRILATIAES